MIDISFNARNFTFESIGKTFVLHPDFNNLASSENTIIIGPRGTGKTTMLKMLSQEALDNWNVKTGVEREIKKQINFISFYIPMSKILHDDLDSRFSNCTLSQDEKRIILDHIYLINVLESIIFELKYLINKKELSVYEKLEFEIKITKLLVPIIKIDTQNRKISDIKSLLTFLSIEKRDWREAFSKKSVLKTQILFSNIITFIEPILQTISEVFHFPIEQKFALCFDELDVYASKFTTTLFRSLRGINPNILLKLSIAPIQEIDAISLKSDLPININDFNVIYLWPLKENEANYRKFIEKLSIITLHNRFPQISKKDILEKILGSFSYQNIFQEIKNSESGNFTFRNYKNIHSLSDNQLTSLLFLELYETDPNFKKFIYSVGINIHEIKSQERKIDSAITRKIKEIVFNRIIYSKYSTLKRVRQFKTVKAHYLYHGKETFINIVDGNPRYLKKLIEFVGDELKFIDGQPQRINISRQAECIIKLKNIFINRLNSIPIGNKIDDSIGDFVEKIGKYFSHEINIKEIKGTGFASVISVTKLEKRELDPLEFVFKEAINNGALLMIESFDLLKLNSVKGRKMRLNFLLHPEFKLPLRIYNEVSFENLYLSNTSSKFNDNQLHINYGE